MTDIVNKV